MMSLTKAFILPLALATVGCVSMAPRYKAPAPPVPRDWPEAAWAKGTGAVRDLPWQEFYQDPGLRKVLDLALKNNRDLRVATLNVEKARAMYQIQRADLLPAVNVVGQGNKQRLPASVSSVGRSIVTEQDAVNVGITAWELDLFGRVRSLKNRALEQYFATEQARNAAQISLLAEVANAYLTLAADRETLKLAQDTLASQEASHKLVQRRFEVGASSELDVHRSRTSVETARADVLACTRAVAMDRNALDLLAGSPVGPELSPQALAPVTAVKDIAPGLPSEVLIRRPDVLMAENQLKAANANIGAARAAFFPRIALTTSFGSMANELSGLFKSGSRAWAFTPQAVLPIFDTGSRWASLKAATADRDILVAQYEKAIQTAFREVADALAARGTLDEQLAAQETLTAAMEKTHRLASARYSAGIDSYLSVLDAQRALYGAQKGLIALRRARFASMVGLYKVLGGGVSGKP